MRYLVAFFLVIAVPLSHAQTIDNLGAGNVVQGTDLFPSYQGANPATAVSADQIKQYVGAGFAPMNGALGGDLAGSLPNPLVMKSSSGALTFPSAPGPITSNSGSGYWQHSGPLLAVGNPAAPKPVLTKTGAQLFSDTNGVANALVLNDLSQAPNNKVAAVSWAGGLLSLGFVDDAWTSSTIGIAISGGFAGVTGIQSNSGSGSWQHTGDFQVTDTAAGRGIQLSGASTTPSVAVTGPAGAAIDLMLVPTGSGSGVIVRSPTNTTSLEFRGGAGGSPAVISTGGSTNTSGILFLTRGIAPVQFSSSGGGIQLSPSDISNLPSCTATSAGTLAVVADGVATPTYRQAVGTTTGTATQLVACDGGTTPAWTYH